MDEQADPLELARKLVTLLKSETHLSVVAKAALVAAQAAVDADATFGSRERVAL